MPLEFTKATDRKHTIKLKPALIYAVWRTGLAPEGGQAAFEVATALVGYGAPVEITARNDRGKKLGAVKGKMARNKFVGVLAIPADVEPDEEVYFEVKLPNNGIAGESNRIPAVPSVRVTALKWDVEEARRGDVVTLSATVEGVREGTDTRIVIREYDADGAHDTIAELPCRVKDRAVELKWEYEYHEDVDEIPSEAEMQRYGRSYNPPEYFFEVHLGGSVFGQGQESGLLTFRDYVDIEFLNRDGSPAVNVEYKVILADGSELSGVLDTDGKARVENVPPGQFKVLFLEGDR